MAPYRSRKSAPTECATDEEGTITYDVEEGEVEPNPADKYIIIPHQNLNELKSRVSSKMGVLLVPKGPSRSVCANSISKETGQCNKEEGLVQGRNYVYIEEFPIRPQYREEGTTDRRGRSHPPQCTTSREDRQIVRMAVMDRSVTSRTIAQHIESVTHHSVSARTIRRRLQQSGLSARRPLLGLPLTQNHRRLHRQWCDERRIWVAEGNEVVFTDESHIYLQHHNGRIRAWRHRGERMLNSGVMPHHTGPASCIMVWGGIGYHSRSLLVPIAGRSRKISISHEEAERTERPIRRLSKVMYGSTCADMQEDVMGECLSSIKHVVGEQLSGGFSSGRSRGTTPADDRYIVLQARRNRRQTAGEIARHTTQATGRPISRFTVARRLHGGGLFARRPVRCVSLTPAHRRRRSLWCREHRNWRDNEWGRVLFTDESRFSLSSDSHRILIWRERGSRNHPSNIIERDRYGGRGVLVWGGIMLGSRTDLHIFDAGSVNGTRYCNEILLPYVRLFRGAMGLQFLFMDDNAPCHRTVAVEQLLESEDIERMGIGRHNLRISIPSSSMYGIF
ncbi:transposable element Tcb1 transposase [Trichonephila clavipes]|nr:transposable element Tcb1 transposase [Trichonephila clavipes]